MQITDPYLSQIIRLTSDKGIYQHAKEKIPDPIHGYALEDQARALIVCHEFNRLDLEKIYLDFITKAKRPDGFFYQYYYEDERGFENNSSEIENRKSSESFAITLWSLLQTGQYQSHKTMVDNLISDCLNWTSLRPIAEALLGLSESKKPIKEETILINRLVTAYKENCSSDWQWFEDKLTYANALLPWALWAIALARQDKQAAEIACQATNFLLKVCQVKGVPCPIGNHGWYLKDGKKALYDQQPIDPAYMVCCLEKAFEATKNKDYLKQAENWWNWFLGNNLNKVSMITKDFACYDGLNKEGPNKNQGAESNICFLMAYLAAKRLKITK